jgi:hypothetical protein
VTPIIQVSQFLLWRVSPLQAPLSLGTYNYSSPQPLLPWYEGSDVGPAELVCRQFYEYAEMYVCLPCLSCPTSTLTRPNNAFLPTYC